MADDIMKCCCPPPGPGPDKKDPFPAMSAHFAHTLDDMREQYLQAQYIDIDGETGVLDSDSLQKLLQSRTNMLVYQNRVFRFSSQEAYLYNYINVYKLESDTSYKVQLISINTLTGAWVVTDIGGDSKAEIDVLKEDITNIKNDITNIIENVTTETEERKAADEQIIQDTTTSFNAVKDELEVIDEDIQNEISARESADEALRAGVDSNKESIESNTRDIETLEAGFEAVDEALEQMDESITGINTKIDNIGESLNMDGGEVEEAVV